MIEIIGNKKYKKVYISGPMTGIENLNKFEFKKYEEKFKNLNFEVINPHNLFSKDEVKLMDDLLKEKKITFEEHHSFFMKRDIKEMMNCDFLTVLNGWEKSKGANIEVYIARNLKMPIVDSVTLKELF